MKNKLAFTVLELIIAVIIACLLVGGFFFFSSRKDRESYRNHIEGYHKIDCSNSVNRKLCNEIGIKGKGK